ncbi:hypothetical protein V6Z11_D07G190900, partial [Gossypium hirsutum]
DKSGFINLVSRHLNEEEPQIEWSKVEIPTEYEMIVPYQILPPFLDDATETRRLLDKLVVLRLNGDLGTAIGSDGPKYARAFPLYIFLVAIQIENLNWKYGCNVPLLLLNSFNTHVETLKTMQHLDKWVRSNVQIYNILQVAAEDFTPLPCKGETGKDGWYSPGHGEFQCLRNSGMLDEFISQEKEILFFANIDNLGALLDFRILKHMVENQKEFCMELTTKTSHDQMTGTLISYERKVQVKEFDSAEKLQTFPYQYYVRRRFLTAYQFRTNGLRYRWMDLNAIKRLIDADALMLHIFENLKEVQGTKVVQFETVAGDAIKFFDRAIGINVPRARYLPLRTTTMPSIIELDSLKVTGEVRFGSRVVLEGKVSIAAKPGEKLQIPDKKVIEDKEINGPEDL